MLQRAGKNSKMHHYKRKVQKMKDLPKTGVWSGKQFEDFKRKKEQTHYSRPLKKPSGTQGSKLIESNEQGLHRQQDLNYAKFEKSIQIKLLELGKTRTKKSTPDFFNFFAVLAGHDKVSDGGSVISCRRKFKDGSLQTKCTKNVWPSENRGLIGKTVWRFQKKKRTETLFTTFQKAQWNTRDLFDWVQWTRPS